MKKILAIFLALVTILMCSACLEGEKKDAESKQPPKQAQTDEKAEKITQEYLELLFNGKFAEAEEYLFFDTERFVEVMSKVENGGIIYENGKIEIDGENFSDVDEFIEQAEINWGEKISLASLEYKEKSVITVEELKKIGNVPEFFNEFFDDFDKEKVTELYSVDFYAKITGGEESIEGTVTVFVAEKDGELKVVAPTWATWILCAFTIFK